MVPSEVWITVGEELFIKTIEFPSLPSVGVELHFIDSLDSAAVVDGIEWWDSSPDRFAIRAIASAWDQEPRRLKNTIEKMLSSGWKRPE